MCIKGIFMIDTKESKNSSNLMKPVIKKELIKYICLNCKYRFQRSLDHGIVRTCPYCGRNTVQKEPKLDTLLKQVSGFEED